MVLMEMIGMNLHGRQGEVGYDEQTPSDLSEMNERPSGG